MYYMQVRERQLTGIEQQVSESIKEQSAKEGLLVALKQRAEVTKKILGVQQQVGKVIDTVGAFVSVGRITNVSLDDHNTVVVTIQASSTSDTVLLVDALIKQAAGKNVRSPELVSLGIGNTGDVELTVSFVEVF